MTENSSACEMRQIYKNPYCLPDYFEIYDKKPDGFIEFKIDGEKHILPYCLRGRSAYVLNSDFKISTEALQKGCEKIFSAESRITNIEFEKIEPIDLRRIGYHSFVTETSEDMVLPLPGSFEEYEKKLGSKTKKHLRYYVRRLEKTFDDYRFVITEKEDIGQKLIGQIIDMNRDRMRDKSKTSGIDKKYEERIADFARTCGIVYHIEIEGEPAGGAIVSKIEDEYYLHVIAHKPVYNKFNIGQSALYLAILSAIENGGNSFHFLWGVAEYKTRLGGVKKELISIVVFRNISARIFALPRQIGYTTKTGLTRFIKNSPMLSKLATKIRKAGR